jgi:hypothetical protein
MGQERRRTCVSCGESFAPDPRNTRRYRYCTQPACRAASKRASQAKWLAKPEIATTTGGRLLLHACGRGGRRIPATAGARARCRSRIPRCCRLDPALAASAAQGACNSPQGSFPIPAGGRVTRCHGVAVTRDLGCPTLCSDWLNQPSLGLCVTRGDRLRGHPVATTGSRHLRRRP